jgi:predicted nucleotidyltransferase
MKIKKKEFRLYPSNREIFKKLIPFAQKIISICKENKIDFLIYGSFAHFYHTRDEKMSVNDIDIIISNHKKNFPKLVKLLKKEKIKFDYFPEWETMIIKKGKLKVEIDSVGLGYKRIKEEIIFKKMDIMK